MKTQDKAVILHKTEGGAIVKSPMTFLVALTALENVIPALEYLQAQAQGSVNSDADDIVDVRKRGENVSPKAIMQSGKSMVKQDKAILAVKRSIEFARLGASMEKAIPAEVVREPALIA